MDPRNQSHTKRCAHCGAKLNPDNRHHRFCSQQCLDDYGAMFNKSSRPYQNHFSLTDEITKLQDIIRHEVSRPPEDLADSRNTIAFYENVVERTRKILKWINASALINQDSRERELKETRDELNRVKKKMEILLKKAADIKRENKMLRKKSAKLPSTEAIAMARKILGVTDETDIHGLKKAFRRKAKLIHPDRKYGDPDLFKSLKTAYQILERTMRSE